jgi:hypothetical protein
MAFTGKWTRKFEAPFSRLAHVGASRARGTLREAYHLRIVGVRLPRLLSLIPLAVYGTGALTILVGSMLGDWQLAFHPDALFPFELMGLTACVLALWRA